jgi:hypothetical protein
MPIDKYRVNKLKTFIARVAAVTWILISITIYEVGEPLFGFALGLLSLVIMLLAEGRDKSWPRRYIEIIPGVSYDFPPLDEVEVIQNE